MTLKEFAAIISKAAEKNPDASVVYHVEYYGLTEIGKHSKLAFDYGNDGEIVYCLNVYDVRPELNKEN